MEQGVEAGACVVLQKKSHKKALFRKWPITQYATSRPWNQAADNSNSKAPVTLPKQLIFGGTLDEALAGRDIPSVMSKCIAHVRERGLDKEGIFRLSGSATAIESLKRSFNEGQDVDLSKCPDTHIVCGLLKQFLRELREPLLTFELYDTFLQANCDRDKVKSALSSLPMSNLRVLKYLIEFLFEVAQHSANNKMPVHNLATVFAPNLLRMREEDIFKIVQDTPASNAFTSYLIQNYHVLLTDNGAAITFAVAPGTSQRGFLPTPRMDYISYMQVAHAYEPHDPTELALEPSEIIGVLEENESGWWKGEMLDPNTMAPSGTIGIFPATYCESYHPIVPPSSPPPVAVSPTTIRFRTATNTNRFVPTSSVDQNRSCSVIVAPQVSKLPPMRPQLTRSASEAKTSPLCGDPAGESPRRPNEAKPLPPVPTAKPGPPPAVPPKELKPRLAQGRPPNVASSSDSNLVEAAVDWEKVAHRLQALLEQEQLARMELERRVKELEQILLNSQS